MNEVCVQKTGNVYVVFVDPTTSIPVPFSDYDSPPEFTFPQTYNEGDLRATYRGCTFKFIEKVRKEPPTVQPLTREQRIQHGLAMQLSPEDQKLMAEKSSAPKPSMLPGLLAALPALMAAKQSIPTDQSEVAKVIDAAHDQDKAVQEFKILLARYYANTKDSSAKIAVESVGSFLLALWPSLADKLQEAKASFEKPRFSL